MANRYRLQVEQAAAAQPLDPPSHGSTLFDTDFVDAIAGQIGLGLLLRGTSTRFGQLIDRLGDRNFLRVKIDPSHRLRDRDLVREELGVPIDNEHFTGWCVSAQRDPDRGYPRCGDCLLNGHHPYRDSSAVLLCRPPDPTEA